MNDNLEQNIAAIQKLFCNEASLIVRRILIGAKIPAAILFVDELTDKELETFLDHIYGCSACHEELEIYYTLYAGLAQLDGENEGQDMHNLLEEALYASEERVKGRKLFNIYYTFSQVLAMAALVVVIVMEIMRL